MRKTFYRLAHRFAMMMGDVALQASESTWNRMLHAEAMEDSAREVDELKSLYLQQLEDVRRWTRIAYRFDAKINGERT